MIQSTRYHKGKIDAECKIGFSALSFGYVSCVTYEEPSFVLSESSNSRIFDSLYSEWRISRIAPHECEVNYKIIMTFNNPLYTQITRQFFDLLTKNINQSFEQRCQQLYYSNPLKIEPDEEDMIPNDLEK